MNPIDVNDFVSKRSDDIDKINAHLESRKKKSMAFQKLPHFKRRRTGSPHPKRRRQRKRFKNEWTFLHRYFAKRFSMINLNNLLLPYERNQKSFSLLDKGHNFLYFTGMKCFIFARNQTSIDIFKNKNKDSLYKNSILQNLKNFNFYSKKEYSEQKSYFFETDQFFILVGEKRETIDPILQTENVFKLYKETDEDDNGIYLINSVKKNENFEIDSYLKEKFNNVPSNNQDNRITSENSFILKLNHKFAFIILFSNQPKICSQYLIYNYFMISASEHLRLCLEYLYFPIIFKDSKRYTEYEFKSELENCKKWWRTPTGKRKNYLSLEENNKKIENNKIIENHEKSENHKIIENKTIYLNDVNEDDFIFPFKLPTLNLKNANFFTSSGALKRGARVFEQKKIIGYIIYSCFSYRHGKFMGILAPFDDLKSKLYIGCNLFSSKEIKIEILRNQIE